MLARGRAFTFWAGARSPRKALLETLRVTLEQAIKLNRAEARRAAGRSSQEITIAV